MMEKGMIDFRTERMLKAAVRKEIKHELYKRDKDRNDRRDALSV